MNVTEGVTLQVLAGNATTTSDNETSAVDVSEAMGIATLIVPGTVSSSVVNRPRVDWFSIFVFITNGMLCGYCTYFCGQCRRHDNAKHSSTTRAARTNATVVLATGSAQQTSDRGVILCRPSQIHSCSRFKHFKSIFVFTCCNLAKRLFIQESLCTHCSRTYSLRLAGVNEKLKNDREMAKGVKENECMSNASARVKRMV